MNIKPIFEAYTVLLASFTSGNPHLDTFIKERCAYDVSIGKTYLFLSDNEEYLIGHYNLGMGSIDALEDGHRRKVGGAVHINCFAIDKKYQDKVLSIDEYGEHIHLSDMMWYDCLERIETLRVNHIGAAYVTLVATEEGRHFYERNDFLEFEADCAFTMEEAELQCTPMYYDLDSDFFSH